MDISDWEAELQKEELDKFERQEAELDQPQFVDAVHDISPPFSSLSSTTASCSPFTPMSLHAEEMDIIDMERRGLEGEAQMVDISLGPLSPTLPDTDFDFEEEIYGLSDPCKKRKKSIQKIAQLTGLMLGVEPVEREYVDESLTSPLKEGFTFGEIGGEDWDIEREIDEEERRGNVLRRRVGRGEVGEFGDEDEDC
jgi:hypothetical protein